MAYEDLSTEDRRELESSRNLLYRAVKEMDYIHSLHGTEYDSLVVSDEGLAVIEYGMKLLGVADLSEDELPMRLVRA